MKFSASFALQICFKNLIRIASQFGSYVTVKTNSFVRTITIMYLEGVMLMEINQGHEGKMCVICVSPAERQELAGCTAEGVGRGWRLTAVQRAHDLSLEDQVQEDCGVIP